MTDIRLYSAKNTFFDRKIKHTTGKITQRATLYPAATIRILRRSILAIFVLSQFILASGQKVPFECSLDGMQGVVFVVPSVYSSNSQLITVT